MDGNRKGSAIACASGLGGKILVSIFASDGVVELIRK
jgi:hypothetical protein